MIDTKNLFSFLKKNKIDFFCGVPDSVLKETRDKFSNFNKKKHLITHNEGGAIALASGYYLKTKKIACVYLQNSGLGNIVNPLLSMAHKNVYSIPVVLMIGWRGAPNQKDEPQHLVQGKITRELLKLLNVEYCILSSKKDFKSFEKLIKKSLKKKKPVACLIKKNILKNFSKKKFQSNKITNKFKRHEVLKFIIDNTKEKIKIFSTTGFTSRELYQLRKIQNQSSTDFYNVGAMGHTSMLALGYSIFSDKKNILCLDGDGSMLMHMGSLGTIGEFANNNFKHIMFNNKQHESVGGQMTPVNKINFKNLSLACGYKRYFYSNNMRDFKKKYKFFINSKGPSFFEIEISSGTLSNLGRPKDLIEIKNKFQK